jgi:hypothetical protein
MHAWCVRSRTLAAFRRKAQMRRTLPRHSAYSLPVSRSLRLWAACLIPSVGPTSTSTGSNFPPGFLFVAYRLFHLPFSISRKVGHCAAAFSSRAYLPDQPLQMSILENPHECRNHHDPQRRLQGDGVRRTEGLRQHFRCNQISGLKPNGLGVN